MSIMHAVLPQAAEAVDAVRERSPLVHCITNAVVTNVTANLLLAAGAAPAMVDIPVEAGAFARVASGLLVNLGTPHAEQREAALEASEAAAAAGTPWVLDPVAVGALPVRTELATTLVERRPTIVRGNASEILAVAAAGAGGRGVDATDDVDAAIASAQELATRTGGCVAISGRVDAIVDASRVVRVANGTALLTRMTGAGCGLGALMAASASQQRDPLVAAVAATLLLTVAAERAAAASTGPGSFQVALLDAIDAVDGAAIADAAVLR